MSKLGLRVEEINALDKTEIANYPAVREKFVDIYNAMWSRSTGISGEAVYERESRNFNRILSEKEDIRTKCTNFSIFTAFLDVAISGLTLDPGTKAQAYLMARNIATDSYYDNGQKKNKYETQCVLTVSGYGELVLRARCGQIQYADNPVIVYAEDEFEYGERNGQKFVNYGCRLPHNSGQIVACFMKITRADSSIDYSVMLPEDWGRLAGYSARQNRKWNEQKKRWETGGPNALYGLGENGSGQIDPGFLIAKCIKHAFKAYPKARVGKGTQLESQQVDEVEVADDIYGVVDTETGEVQSPHNDAGFEPANDVSAGVTVTVADEEDVDF